MKLSVILVPEVRVHIVRFPTSKLVCMHYKLSYNYIQIDPNFIARYNFIACICFIRLCGIAL